MFAPAINWIPRTGDEGMVRHRSVEAGRSALPPPTIPPPPTYPSCHPVRLSCPAVAAMDAFPSRAAMELEASAVGTQTEVDGC